MGMRRALVLSMLLSTACAEESSQEYAVTITDAISQDCRGESDNDAFEPQTLEQVAIASENQFEESRLAEPPSAEGRILRINDFDGNVRAWFDAPLNGFGVEFASPGAVYLGTSHSDYIEGEYKDLFNTDALDEQQGREPCGDRPRATGVLSATIGNGLIGRIRWTEYTYIPSVTSSCAARVACVRDVAVEGLGLVRR
jgi:hypothetical protein